MNIIEKLGITPGPWCIDRSAIVIGSKCVDTEWKDERNRKTEICSIWDTEYPNRVNNNASVIAAAPEMLEALIGLKMLLLNHTEWAYKNNNQMYLTAIGNIYSKVNLDVIEKATGKTWEEIKELMEVVK